MGIFTRLFGSGKSEKPGKGQCNYSKDPEKLYRDGLKQFGEGKFRDAAQNLEEVIKLNPTSAPAYFTLGATYSRIAGEYGSDENAIRPWIEKSAESFRKALRLASQYGGLNPKQIDTAKNVVTAFDRVVEKQTPSLPEEQRKKIYADFMETKDTELLLGTNLARDVMMASGRPGGLAQMMQSLNSNSAKANEAAAAKITNKYHVNRGQLMAIEEEGKKNKWPFKAVAR